MYLSWRAGMPSVHITTLLKPFRNPTAFEMESKLLSLDSGQPFAHLSISEQTFGHVYPSPLLMLSPLPGISTLLSLPLLPSMSHSSPSVNSYSTLNAQPKLPMEGFSVYLGLSQSC